MHNPSTEKLMKIGRSFYGICMATFGINQLVFADFRNVILPPWPSWRATPGIWAYVVAMALIGAGIAIIFDKKSRVVALVLGGIFLALVVFWHLPYMLFVFPHHLWHLGVWTDAGKALALSGGAFVVAGSLREGQTDSGNKSLLIMSIICKIRLSVIALLQGIMLFLWVILLHIPHAIANPRLLKGIEIVSAADALAFSGTAFLLACGARPQGRTEVIS